MAILKLHLINFRNQKGRKIDFNPKTTIILGPNASGKTNILEGIYFVSSAKSFRAKIEEEMINSKSEIARISAWVIKDNDDQKIKLEAILTRGLIGIGEERMEKIQRKKLMVNGIARRLVDFAGNFKCVLFRPEDLDLVTQAPSLRRKFLDMVISQVDREYRRALLSYEKGLRQRNRLLLRIREEGLSRSQLLFWDRLLIKNGDYITKKREEFLDFANNFEYQRGSRYFLEYEKSAISEGRLEQYAQEEVAAATTLVGPHRDDFCFLEGKEKRNLSSYGSRGEQRMGILWLKRVELSFIEEKTQDKPTLLLDDIFSELDEKHRELVYEISLSQQTIITTADPFFVKKYKKVEKILI